ncbi:MAG TPA: TIM barrel protein [Puia sp.]
MKLGIGSFTYGWAVGVKNEKPLFPLTPEKIIERAVEMKISLVQFGDNISLVDYAPARLAQLKTLIEERNVVIELGGRGMTPENLDRYLALCRFFNAKLLRFVVDGDQYHPSIHEIIRTLEGGKKGLNDHGVTLAIENHDRLKTRDLVYIMRALDTQEIGICLDTVNSLGAGEGFDTVLEGLAPFTVNLHIKDYDLIRPEHKMGFIVTGKIAGSGFLNIPLITTHLSKYGKCKTAILEQWVPPGKNLEDTIIMEYEWAKSSVCYLRTIKGLEF